MGLGTRRWRGLGTRIGAISVLCILTTASWAAPVAPTGQQTLLDGDVAAEAAPSRHALAEAVSADESEIPQSGLPKGPAADGYRNDLERSWFGGGASLQRRAGAVHDRAVQLGATAVSGPALALIAPSAGSIGLEEAELGVKISPDLPLAHVALASAHWAEGELGAALGAFVKAVQAIPRNLEATVWFASSALLMFIATGVLAALAFIAMTGLSVFPRAAHDLGDLFSKDMPGFARAALLGTVVLLPLALGEGLVGLVLGLFAVGVAYGSSGHRVALALAATMFVLVLFPVSELGGRALSMLFSDPVARSVFSVEQGIEGSEDLALLRSAEEEDPIAAHALAVYARRTGRLDEAYHRYVALLEKQPRNPVVMNNLANLEFQRGSLDEAIRLYERASAVLESPVLWFNLSQAYARSFRMEKFEKALQRAQNLGPKVVANFSAQKDPGLIADLPIPISMLRSRMFEASDGAAFASSLRAPLTPGYAARDWKAASLSFGMIFLAASLFATRFDHAGTCGRCGVRICARCDGTVWNSLTCENCHRLFNHPEATDATLRAMRLGELRTREARIERAVRIASLLVPGVGGILARRPGLAFLALAFFGWSVVAFVWRAGVVPDPLVVGSAGSALFLTTAIASALVYARLVVTGLAIRRNL